MDPTATIASLILTAFAYLAFPLFKLLINGRRFSKDRAKKIALWNSIVVGAFFCIITTSLESVSAWSASPALLYYWVNSVILTNKNVTYLTLKCPNCRKKLEIEETRTSVCCPHCGINITFEDDYDAEEDAGERNM